MNVEQTEAKVLELAADAKVFGDYYLTEPQLLTLIQLAHLLGRQEEITLCRLIADSAGATA